MNPDLSPDLIEAITPFVGDLRSVGAPVERGHSSDITAVVEGSGGRFFIKGICGGGARRASLVREAAINPHVRGFSPPLLWQAEHGAWLVLGFQVLDGFRAADFRPGSPDLPMIIGTLDRIGSHEVPPVARDWTEKLGPIHSRRRRT